VEMLLRPYLYNNNNNNYYYYYMNIPIIIGANGMVTKGTKKTLEAIPGNIKVTTDTITEYRM
jgi:hypothetical protein